MGQATIKEAPTVGNDQDIDILENCARSGPEYMVISIAVACEVGRV